MADAAQRLDLTCPAKVNFALSVGAPQSDGMHPIASWMAAIHLTDSLSLTRLDHPLSTDTSSHYTITFTTGDDALRPDAVVDWPLDRDLAVRAHRLLEAHVGRTLPIDATLTKRIPTGAGLGGGSSDAAAMLVGLNQLFNLGLGVPALTALSTKLGSDVAFFIHAAHSQPSAIVTGLGEVITPAPIDAIIPLVLIVPPFGCPTAPVYRAFDALLAESPREFAAPHVDRVRALSLQSPLPQSGPFNDLAEPACRVEPRLRDAIDQVQQAMHLPVHVTGSGSTLFLIAPTALTAKAMARKVTATTGLPALATRTV